MFIHILRVIDCVLAIPVFVLALRGVLHLPRKGSDDPRGTTRKCLLAAGAVSVVILVFGAIGDIVAFAQGTITGGVLGPLSYLVMDAAAGYVICRLIVDFASISSTLDARMRAIILFALCLIYFFAEFAGVDSVLADRLLSYFCLASIGLLSLVCHAFLRATAGISLRAAIIARTKGE